MGKCRDYDDTSILVIGGTGSFGQKLVDTLMKVGNPRRLVIFSRGEFLQDQMRQKWPESDSSPIRYFIGDVRDHTRLERAFQDVDIVIHAAALKQIVACEYNPIEAVRTNIDGAVNVIDVALDCGVEKVIALSSDKATAPTNLYGATKLVAEKLFVQANSYRGWSSTKLSCVRYGNVLGSRGSVVPVFKTQAATGMLTVTHVDMTRFWLTLQQGIDFVLSCLKIMQGGEIFIPKLPSMRIIDMATALAPRARIEFTGIRPGEKLHEAMISVDESYRTVDIGDRYVILPSQSFWQDGKSWSRYPFVTPGWSYTSGTNDRWLTTDELTSLLEEKDLCKMQSS